MYEEPNDDDSGEGKSEHALSPADRAREKSDELRTHAERFAIFEGVRKFEAGLYPGLDAQIARDLQRGVGKLEKAKSAESPVLPEPSAVDAAALLNLYNTHEFSTNDYHIHRRPGEVMIVRWLAGEQVETFYERLQAHFDAAMEGYREDERQATEWKKDPQTQAYLEALDKVEVKMAERYLRDVIRKHNAFVLSTQTADEISIAYLCDYIMGVPAGDVVGVRSAPPEEPSDSDLAWFYKLFSLRGIIEGVERMCFFTYLQKSDDSFDGE